MRCGSRLLHDTTRPYSATAGTVVAVVSAQRRSPIAQVMHVGVGELYCEAAMFDNMNHRDHISDTVYVDRRQAPSLYAAAPPPPQHSTLFTSAPRTEMSSLNKPPNPPPAYFGGTAPSDVNHHANVQVIVPTDREHVSWNEFQAINKGIPRERIQEVWKTTPWFRTPDPNRFAAAGASDRVSWNDFQRILKGKDKQVRVVSTFGLGVLNCWLTLQPGRRFASFGTNTARAATALTQI